MKKPVPTISIRVLNKYINWKAALLNMPVRSRKKDWKINFWGKNFVFDQRRGERVTSHIISNCHQCGEPCDTHINCANEACHLLFLQCESCSEKMQNCCSDECVEIINLPQEEQKRLRQGIPNSNKIFKKGRSEKLIFKSFPQSSPGPSK